MWDRRSGVFAGSSQAHKHRTGTETLRLLVEVDQCDALNLMSAENLVRRLVQLELAVERNPTHPDSAGLNEIIGGTLTEGGAAVTTKFRAWVAGRQKDQTQVLKQARLEREELAATRATGGRAAASGADEGGGGGRGGGGGGRGKPKQKSKAKADSRGGKEAAAAAQ